MSRPKSMYEFTSLLDSSMPPPLHPYDKSREQHPRKKPSISLAAGLIMASAETQSPRSFVNTNPSTGSGSGSSAMAQQDNSERNRNPEGWSEGLFYAYAQKDIAPPTPPSVLTFSSASTASQWWNLVQIAYPNSTRPSPQFFILRTTSTTPSPSSYPDPIDPLVQIQQNPHFSHLHNKWFFSTPTIDPSTSSIPSPAIIPLQDVRGYPIQSPVQNPAPVQPAPQPEPATTPDPNISALTTALSTLTTLTTENTTQIHALSIAQSTGLTTMQQFHETSTTQLQSLASSLQSLLDSTNTTTSTLKSTQSAQKQDLQSQAKNLVSLANTQKALLETSSKLVATIDSLTTRVENMSTSPASNATHSNTSRPSTPLRSKSNSFALSDTSTLTPSSPPFPPSLFPQPQQQNIHRTRISPPPRKLNRRIKGVWYEYDTTPIAVSSAPTSAPATPAKSVAATATASSTPKGVSATSTRSTPSFDPGKAAVAKSGGVGSTVRPATVSAKGKA